MKHSILSLALLFVALPVAAQSPAPPEKPKSCLAVVDAGSHGVRNFMLAGVAGALMSKKQYKVVAVVNYPAHVGEKMHGNDLQLLQTSGTQIVILDKKYDKDELKAACQK